MDDRARTARLAACDAIKSTLGDTRARVSALAAETFTLTHDLETGRPLPTGAAGEPEGHLSWDGVLPQERARAAHAVARREEEEAAVQALGASRREREEAEAKVAAFADCLREDIKGVEQQVFARQQADECAFAPHVAQARRQEMEDGLRAARERIETANAEVKTWLGV
jgi:hypothetical protein